MADSIATECSSAATPIHDIQGMTPRSSRVNQIHTVHGIVTADFSKHDQLEGYYIQSALSEQDQDNRSSEGIFIHRKNFPRQLSVGDLISARGKVVEFHGSTRIQLTRPPIICSSNHLIIPTVLKLPNSAEALEALEGMLVELPQTLTITDNTAFEKWATLTLGLQRQFFATSTNTRSTQDSIRHPDSELIDTIILDHNSHTAFPSHSTSRVESPEHLLPKNDHFQDNPLLRTGNQINSLQGILDYQYGQYRLYPLKMPTFNPTNPRPSPPSKSAGTQIRLVSFNLKNYFNGPQFPTSRGVHSAGEFEIQQLKTVAALSALNADIIGLQELENDGYEAQSAIQTLTEALSLKGIRYHYIRPTTLRLGSDRIAVGILYRADKLTPMSRSAHSNSDRLNSSASAPKLSPHNRVPMTQSFQLSGSEYRFTVSVNHFKSKAGCPSKHSKLLDQDHGMGCWNSTRNRAAKQLSKWLINNIAPRDQPIFILADLNSYPHESPLKSFADAQFEDLLQPRVAPQQNYSYVHRSKPGRLDYVLLYSAPPHETDLQTTNIRVNRVGIWHINADEITPPNRAAPKADHWIASSDHDPVFVDFEFLNPLNL
ncbi:MAG: hypothetical protein COB51_12045 [Moraxellaceae bacterium]|nr:MAG: hypothetical protein COB51_12045 [Moraxellaceae bacterium]